MNQPAGRDTGGQPHQPTLLEHHEAWLTYVADLWARATPDDPDAMAALIDLPRRTQLMNEIWDLTDRFTRQLGVHLPRQSRTNCR